MLPPFIIEQIRKREESEAERRRPRLELPLERYVPPRVTESEVPPAEDAPERGVIILDLG